MEGNPLRKFVPGNDAARKIKRESGAIPDHRAAWVEDAARREALFPLLPAFRAGGTARIVAGALTASV